MSKKIIKIDCIVPLGYGDGNDGVGPRDGNRNGTPNDAGECPEHK